MSSNPYQSSSVPSSSSSSSSVLNSYGLNPNKYVMVNVWTAEDDIYIPGHNVGHVSIQTQEAYYSLWPAPRLADERISRSSLSKVERIARDLTKHFAGRPPRYIQNYSMDCLLEGASESHILPYKESNQIPDDGYQLIIFDTDTCLFRIAETQPPQLQLEETESLLWIKPLHANVRLAFYSLDIGKISSEFTALRNSVNGWSMAGSNLLQQTLGMETKESCASLAYRILSAGGFQSLLPALSRGSMSLETSSFVKPGQLAKRVFEAKYQEQTKPETAVTVDWSVENESNLEVLQQYYAPNVSTKADEKVASNSPRRGART